MPEIDTDQPDTSCAEGFGTEEALQNVAKRYAVRVTSHVGKTIKSPSPDDPVARQYLPDERELINSPDESADPTGDAPHTPVKGIVHRHPDRALFKPVQICAVYCRFCFRREAVGPGKEHLDNKETATALAYIRSHKEIREVIFTGGDPLILSARRLKGLLKQIQDIEHIETIRIHTRIPVADPERVTDDLCKALYLDKPLYIVLHVNHAQEITEENEKALLRLRQAGAILLSQSVLLRGVNDDIGILKSLFNRLLGLGVKPYYLHHPDRAPGTGHFYVPLSEGQKLVKALRAQISGLAMPAYVLDIPGGFGKVPVAAPYITETEDNKYRVEDFHGNWHQYKS